MRAHRIVRLPAIIMLSVLLGLAAVAITSAPAMAADAPGWEVDSHSYPANLAPGHSGTVAVNVENIGGAASGGGATLTDTLPAGVQGVASEGWACTGASPDLCTLELPEFTAGHVQEFLLSVNVSGTAVEGAATNSAAVSGGGATTSVSTPDTLQISSAPVKFGFGHADAWFSNADGTFDTQAGSHPYAFTFNFDLNSNAKSGPVEGEARNISVNLPPGVVGNPNAVTQCTREQFDEEICPTGSQIGVDFAGLGGYLPLITFQFPVYNLVPPAGHPAEFGFILFGNHVFLDASVRSDGDYGITEHVNNLPQREIATNSITVWGDPADPSHDAQRNCLVNGVDQTGCASSAANVPFLTAPTSCAGPQSISASTTNWISESITSEIALQTHDQDGTPQGFEGCSRLNFTPAISAAPDTANADTPAGLTVEIKTPQEGLTSSELSLGNPKVAIAAANIKNTTVALPEGLVINPGQAAGLTACQASEDGVGTQGPPSCPNSSQVGTDEIETPLLAQPLKGHVYILQSNPPHLQLLVAASGSGIDLKLVGTINLDEATGRLSTTFKETPELPFTTFRLSFSGGARAALATPDRCGAYTTASDFTPWSAPFSADAFPSSSFQISSGPNGTTCPGGALPFTPTLTAGSTTDQAGGYTNFSLLLQREDGQQHISTLQFKTPKGLLGMISKVPLCGEPQAAQGTCPAASQIGHTEVTAGPGPYPLVIPEPGQPPAPIYLTGAYKGAPYGLSIAVPVLAGPFNLGTVVVRASIAVDPVTAQLTITTDPLPSILDGVPTDLRTINAVIDKPGFMFNPTNCEAQSFSGTASSTEGATAPISSHFQMGSCRSLSFAPNFKVSTAAQSSKANGASLDAKIVYPTTPLGANQASSQANIASVKVDLPVQLPSRLTTLQKACLAKVFEENPAKCPKESLVGSATAITPVLPVPLTGPAYFVSHGGEAFPSLIVVLQGYGVTVDLTGTTFISKAGITSSTFKQVPDVPISSFDLKLPQGPYSALGANLPESAKGSFCGLKLLMPTAFSAQNGAVIHQSTPIAIEGCSAKLSLITHSVKAKTLTLSVYAPSAGKLKVSGKGLPTITKSAKGRETITIKLKAKRAKAFKTKLKLSFQPSRGKGQAMAVAVRG
jgi:hypothetical protein